MIQTIYRDKGSYIELHYLNGVKILIAHSKTEIYTKIMWIKLVRTLKSNPFLYVHIKKEHKAFLNLLKKHCIIRHIKDDVYLIKEMK